MAPTRSAGTANHSSFPQPQLRVPDVKFVTSAVPMRDTGYARDPGGGR